MNNTGDKTRGRGGVRKRQRVRKLRWGNKAKSKDKKSGDCSEKKEVRGQLKRGRKGSKRIADEVTIKKKVERR